MKKIACTSVGGPDGCAHVFVVKDFEDFMKQAKEHFGGQHADMIKDATDEDKKNWSAMAEKVVSEAQEE